MFKKALATLVILLFLGLAVSPSIYADRDKVSIETTPEFDYDGYVPIQLVFLLINKLRYYKGIEYVESEEDVLEIIENDAELFGIVDELKSFDCGCEDGDITEMKFPIICTLLIPIYYLYMITSSIILRHSFELVENLIITTYEIFNCDWF